MMNMVVAGRPRIRHFTDWCGGTLFGRLKRRFPNRAKRELEWKTFDEDL